MAPSGLALTGCEVRALKFGNKEGVREEEIDVI